MKFSLKRTTQWVIISQNYAFHLKKFAVNTISLVIIKKHNSLSKMFHIILLAISIMQSLLSITLYIQCLIQRGRCPRVKYFLVLCLSKKEHTYILVRICPITIDTLFFSSGSRFSYIFKLKVMAFFFSNSLRFKQRKPPVQYTFMICMMKSFLKTRIK